MNRNWLEITETHLAAEKNIVSVTLVNTRGSAPQIIGAKVLVGENGLLAGTVGGGKVELKVIAHAQELLRIKKENDFKEWNLQTEVGMTCGGVCAFYFERISEKADWKIAVFGAGHVAQELIHILIRLDCSIICLDSREEWLSRLPASKKLQTVLHPNPSELVSTLDPDTFIVCMTMGHAYDVPILKAGLNREIFPYIGAIGSDQKAKVLARDLKANGISEESLKKLYCPIGEEFGNNTPCEIAISVAAQLMRVRDQLCTVMSTKI